MSAKSDRISTTNAGNSASKGPTPASPSPGPSGTTDSADRLKDAALSTAMEITAMPAHLREDAITLWHEVGLTRTWNDPMSDLERALAGPASTVLAALDHDRLVGTVMVGHDGHRGWVYYLAVAPGRQRTGTGRQLMQAAEEWLTGRVPKLQLLVRADNAAAVAFYERLGYASSDVVVLSRWIDGRG